MPNTLSTLGIIHTIISIIALLVGLNTLIRKGRIDPATSRGQLYTWLTIITCVTGFPIMKTGHFTPGHYLSIIIVIMLPIAIYAYRIFGKAAVYVQAAIMSATVFLSLIPAVVETTTRLPVSHPFASGPADPLIQKALSGLLLLFVVGTVYQLLRLRVSDKNAG